MRNLLIEQKEMIITLKKLIEIANNYSDVINAVSVGNENTPKWGANNVPVETFN